jgi:hypothetical protein
LDAKAFMLLRKPACTWPELLGFVEGGRSRLLAVGRCGGGFMRGEELADWAFLGFSISEITERWLETQSLRGPA